jgi:molecular chaperone DnaK (HSP70)
MENYYGFDLGDAESAVALLKKGESKIKILDIAGAKSFITAYALLGNGNVTIGEAACYDPKAIERKLRFKSRFLTDMQNVKKDVKSFSRGVLGQMYLSGDLIKGEDSCFYIGCPAGWDKAAREEYRGIFQQVGFPPAKVVSESRRALVSAGQSKYLQVGYDILSRPVLVVDIGSSTTDFAYISGGKEVQLKTGGEVYFGGGIMDEILLEESVKNSRDSKKIEKIFSESEPWRTYCEFAARKLKEKYFSDVDYWSKNLCIQSVKLTGGFWAQN